MSGAVVFAGTRVPLQNLFDSLERDYGLDEFLDQFPSIPLPVERAREPAPSLLRIRRGTRAAGAISRGRARSLVPTRVVRDTRGT
jgi:hypothetical protein